MNSTSWKPMYNTGSLSSTLEKTIARCLVFPFVASGMQNISVVLCAGGAGDQGRNAQFPMGYVVAGQQQSWQNRMVVFAPRFSRRLPRLSSPSDPRASPTTQKTENRGGNTYGDREEYEIHKQIVEKFPNIYEKETTKTSGHARNGNFLCGITSDQDDVLKKIIGWENKEKLNKR